MDIVSYILSTVPLFRHCSDDEILYLVRMGRMSEIKKGQVFDLKKINSFNIVINGTFEIEGLGKTDIVYLSPGSFFGTIPFTDNRHRGTIRAIADSTLLLFSVEDLYRFFFSYYKGLRGYLKTVSKMGFEISDMGSKYNKGNCKILSVFSTVPRAGNTFLSSLLGLSLSKTGKAIILDMSYSGNSIFDLFEKKITIPLSHKPDDNSVAEKIVKERIENINENLDVINVAFGSKVRVNPDIMSPLLFMLSRDYSYIVMDLSNFDHDLRDKAFSLSDSIFAVITNKKEVKDFYPLFDSTLRDGQRVNYVINEYCAGKVNDFPGVILEKFTAGAEENTVQKLDELSGHDAVKSVSALITGKKRAYIFETNLYESLYFSGFFSAFGKKGIQPDSIYSSSFSYIITSLYMLSSDTKDFYNRVIQFFSEDRINKLLNITFPDEYVFQNDSISKYSNEISGKNRLEMFNTLPVVLLGENGLQRKRMFSTGFLKDMIASSFLVYPHFEQKKIAGNEYSSGFPRFRVHVEDLFRSDVDEIINISVNSKVSLNYSRDKILGFYEKSITWGHYGFPDMTAGEMADKNLVIDINDRELKIERILEQSEKQCDKIMKDLL